MSFRYWCVLPYKNSYTRNELWKFRPMILKIMVLIYVFLLYSIVLGKGFYWQHTKTKERKNNVRVLSAIKTQSRKIIGQQPLQMRIWWQHASICMAHQELSELYFVGSMEAPWKVFLLFFLFSDWPKSNHLRSRIERGFLNIFRAIFSVM